MTSSFIPRQLLHPGSRQSNPASRKILSSPCFSAAYLTDREPGTTTALTFGCTLRPLIILAACSKSANREFVHEPIKTCSIGIVFIGVSGSKPMRSEEHTSELQSRGHLVCRLLLEKKKKNIH